VFAASGSKAKIDSLVQRIKDRNTIKIHYLSINVPQPMSPRTYDIIHDSEYDKLLTYVTILQCELNKVPKQTAINSGLKNIFLVKNLKNDGFRSSGFAYNNNMYLDCFIGNEDFRRYVIHHEFFHVLDRAYPAHDNDPVWSGFNEESFKYENDSKTGLANSHAGVMNHPQKGFINLYSMSRMSEDKAEIYEALRMPGKAKILGEWARSDEILARKIKYIQRFCIMTSKPRGTAAWPDPNAKY
jgi:hypothetical protein